MPRGIKNPKKALVVRGQGSWRQRPPLVFDTTAGYLWVGEGEDIEDAKYLFSMSPAQARKLGEFLSQSGRADKP